MLKGGVAYLLSDIKKVWQSPTVYKEGKKFTQ